MARCKNAQVPFDVLHAQRVNCLSETDQLRWIKLWWLAVRERNACLTAEQYGVRFLAHELHIGSATLRRSLARISEKRLISLFKDETVFVYGVMELHKRLDWKPIPEAYL
jgi:hypothetical protein